ncbi:cell envelope integrity protein CreD [Mucilaginibacter sp. HMF5004]|uniref:cell envelope integrity protein CreD n=1 Tax=Mucilaginibacter rivuli TaxID=2857527 RepID=UPI001C5F1B64|nr:cell envelope integrity protein CreD [Mucilaginibacter rivuli]MBW4890674.1 cell envelope integrity protein CreD [Mucilaginibacter rivuli]
MIADEENAPIFENPKHTWYDSILVKLAIIAVLILLLLIPSEWIQSMIAERENSQQETLKSMTDAWSGSQLVQGPVLVIPYKPTATTNDFAYILPENLNIKASVATELHHKGIADITQYNSKVNVQGTFTKTDLTKLGINADQLMLDKARLVFSFSDMKGLKSNPAINVNGTIIPAEPIYADNLTIFKKGLQVVFSAPKEAGFSFNYTLELKGTNELSFLQIGKTTEVEVTGDWKSPYYTGHYSPDKSKADAGGFTAKWKVLDYNRPFPQQWKDNDTLITSKTATAQAAFGVKFSLPIDQYRKTMRTTKYSCLIILLTFVSLFLTEVIRKQRVHVFNYILIGAAMIVYYTLLLSFAEHLGYDVAYLIASVSTITLIAWFTSSLMDNKNVAFLFGAILTTFYGFIYTIIQLEELSLLIGSIALFVVVALLMYFSRKINWEKH